MEQLVRPMASLTNSWVYTQPIPVTDVQTLSFYLDYVKGTSTSLEMLVQFAPRIESGMTYWYDYQESIISLGERHLDDSIISIHNNGKKFFSMSIASGYCRIGFRVEGNPIDAFARLEVQLLSLRTITIKY